MAAKAERITHSNTDGRLAGLQWYKVHLKVASLVGVLEIDGRRDNRFFNGFYTNNQLNGTACAEQMTEAAFRGADEQLVGVVAKNSSDGRSFSYVI